VLVVDATDACWVKFLGPNRGGVLAWEGSRLVSDVDHALAVSHHGDYVTTIEDHL